MATILQKTDKDLRRFFETRYATLNANGMIPDEQVPGQVTDVLNYETKNDFPEVGELDKYYRSDATGKTYKWDAEASEYVEVVIPVVAVTSVAGRAGDVVLAKADVGLGDVVNTGDSATPVENGTTKFTTGGAYTELAKKVDTTTTVNDHALTGNVTVTKGDVGLGNVANTGDSATPVEGGTTKFTTGGAYTELAKKVDTSTTVNGHMLTGNVTVTKGDVGLGNVANTGDSATPVADGTTKFTTGGAYTELAKKMDISSTVGQASTEYVNRCRVRKIAFKPSAFGMPADALLKSVTFYFTDGANPTPSAAAPFAKLVDASAPDTVLGVSAGIPPAAQGKAPIKVTFFSPIRLAEKEYWLEFFNSVPESLQYTGVLLSTISQTETDLYVKTDSEGIERAGWRPTFGGAEWVFDWQTITTALAAAVNDQQEPV